MLDTYCMSVYVDSGVTADTHHLHKYTHHTGIS